MVTTIRKSHDYCGHLQLTFIYEGELDVMACRTTLIAAYPLLSHAIAEAAFIRA